MIRNGEFVVLYGEPSSGKTFVAVDLALRIASGKDWWGYKTELGGVTYLAGDRVRARRTVARVTGDRDEVLEEPTITLACEPMLVAANGAAILCDFHSLRVSYITALARANVPPKVVQALARHSTPLLTYDRYVKLGKGEERRTLDVLPHQASCSRTKDTGTEP